MFHVVFLVSPMCVTCPTQIVRLDVIILVSNCREVEAMVLCMQLLYPPYTAASAGQYPRSFLVPWCGRPGLQNYSVNQWNVLKSAQPGSSASLISKFRTGFWDYSAT